MLPRSNPVGTYRLIWSGDSAVKPLDLPPEPTQDGDSPEALSAFEDAKRARAARVKEIEKTRWNDWRIASETGNWSALIKPGERPTYFVLKSLGYSTVQTWEDAKRENGGTLGFTETYRRLLQLALTGVENHTDVIDCATIADPELGGERRVGDAAIDLLVSGMSLAAADAMVLELAAGIIRREARTDPKS